MSKHSPTDDEEYVAWCRYTGKTIVTCDSDAEGAFRVYRRSDAATIEELTHQRNFLEQNETVVWEALQIADGSTIHEVFAAITKLTADNAELRAAVNVLRDTMLNHIVDIDDLLAATPGVSTAGFLRQRQAQMRAALASTAKFEEPSE